MKVSVIIPCYRQGRYLANAINSCLAQAYRSIEIIVVNDGSDDNTDEVARAYRGSIKYIAKQNGGVSSARNAGIEAASGQYLKFLDGDDHIAPEQIEWQIDAIAGRGNCVAISTLRAYEDGNPGRFVDIVPRFSRLLPDLLDQPDSSPHAWLFPSELVRAVSGWDERYPITQDWDFFCRIGKLRPAVHCDLRVGGFYRLRAGSLSTNKLAVSLEVAQQLISLHDEFRDGPDCEWFGSELLGAEQRTYRNMLLRGCQDVELKRQLLDRILEIRQRVRAPRAHSKFEALCRAFGYAAAERLYVTYLKWVRRRSNAAVIPVNSVSGN